MKNAILLIVIFLSFPSCEQDDKAASPADKPSEQKTVNLTVDGNARAFIAYLPLGYNNAGKMPLLFVLHGQGGTNTGMIEIADFRPIADAEKVVVIYPQGIEKVWNDGRPVAANQMGINDVSFFSQLIDYAVANYSADATKVYATGLSSGGFMSSRLACELSTRIAAIAAVGASIEANSIFPTCNPAKPTPVIYIHGDSDPLVPFSGGAIAGSGNLGGFCISHQEALSKWVSINKCNSTPQLSTLPDIAADGTTITKRAYSGGIDGTQVVGYEVIGGGHTWPQGYQYAPALLVG
ncbi:MAG: alpha/beta hydrolase family esterase, partial [Cytophagales bacterium]